MRVVVPGLVLFAISLTVCTLLFSRDLAAPGRGLPPSLRQAAPPGLAPQRQAPQSEPEREPKKEPKHENDFLAEPPEPEHV